MRGLHFSGLYVATERNPATRLAKLVTTLATAHSGLGSDDPDLFHRLETQLSITEDYEARKLLSVYLSEP